MLNTLITRFYLLLLVGLYACQPTFAQSNNEWMANKASAFLQARVNNTIHWQAWSEAAFAQARREQKPLFVSIGHQRCSWCEAMNKGAFADMETGAYMNAHFINILVDSDMHRDISRAIESFYQEAKGLSGFPMNMWMTPEGIPFVTRFFLDTKAQSSHESLLSVARGINKEWENNAHIINTRAQALKVFLQKKRAEKQIFPVTGKSIEDYQNRLGRRYLSGQQLDIDNLAYVDPATLYFLLNSNDEGSLLALTILAKLSDSALYDHLQGGFFKAALDPDWLKPVFEKDLITQSLLADVYITAWQSSAHEPFRHIAESTINFVLKELASGSGGYYAGFKEKEDNAAAGFYVWDLKRLHAALPHPIDRDLAKQRYGFVVNHASDFSSLHVRRSLESLSKIFTLSPVEIKQQMGDINQALLVHRRSDPAPALMRDIHPLGNALFLRTLAKAGEALQSKTYSDIAETLAEKLTGTDSPVHPLNQRQYAALISGLLATYSANGQQKWLQAAHDLMEQQISRLWDLDQGCFNDYKDTLWLLTCNFDDGHTIAASSLNLENLLILHHEYNDGSYLRYAMTLGANAIYSAEGQLKQIPYALMLYAPLLKSGQRISLITHINTGEK